MGPSNTGDPHSSIPPRNSATAQQSGPEWDRCKGLARQPRILDCFVDRLRDVGLVGEDRVAKIIYLAVTSRLLDRPVSVAVKGTSSAGKSYLVQRVIQFFPDSAYYALSAMSEKALAYSDEPLKHRTLVVYELAGLQGDFGSYLVRSFLSEGRLRYEVTEKKNGGFTTRIIEREGPMGLIVTTTSNRLHPENETRLLSLMVDDSQAQTKAIMMAHANGSGSLPNVDDWKALQAWLESAEHRVVIPYARNLAEAVPPVAVRLRRDFPAVLSLIEANALLHQATRTRDSEGRIVAVLEDYAVVRELVSDLLAEGVQAAVPRTIRETVEAVRLLTQEDAGHPSIVTIAKKLDVDKSTASRRVQAAAKEGYVYNPETSGRAAQVMLGDPLPDDVEVLPPPERLVNGSGCTVAPEIGGYGRGQQAGSLDGCTVAAETEGIRGVPALRRTADSGDDG